MVKNTFFEKKQLNDWRGKYRLVSFIKSLPIFFHLRKGEQSDFYFLKKFYFLLCTFLHFVLIIKYNQK